MLELATGVAEHTEPSNTYNLTHNPYVAKVKDMRGDLLVQHNATLSIVDVTIKSPLCTDIIEAACEKPGATAESSRTRQDIQVQALHRHQACKLPLYPLAWKPTGDWVRQSASS